MLEGKGLVFGYPCGRRILDGMDISLQPGQRLGIVAPSGYGKTTLCKILAGYQQPQGGAVLLDGEPLPKKGYCQVQMIWQHPELVINPRLQMRDTLAEGGGIPAHITGGLGIEAEWLNRYPAELSGGEMQRFCIARALGEGTRYILADEISTMLDLVTQAQIWRFLAEETAKRGIGLLAVSHSGGLLRQVCGGDIMDITASQ